MKHSRYDDGNYARISKLLRLTRNLPGDIVECGFGHGNTFSVFLEVLQELKIERDIWEFDSFEGFPDVHVNDSGGKYAKKGFHGTWFKWENAQLRINKRCVYHKYPIDRIKVIKGFYKDTLPQEYTGNQIVLLHIDCDLYESYKSAFTLFDKVVSGGIVLFDDLKSQWPGADKAVEEILAETKLELKEVNERYYIQKG
jgi:O-methyltransferase